MDSSANQDRNATVDTNSSPSQEKVGTQAATEQVNVIEEKLANVEQQSYIKTLNIHKNLVDIKVDCLNFARLSDEYDLNPDTVEPLTELVKEFLTRVISESGFDPEDCDYSITVYHQAYKNNPSGYHIPFLNSATFGASEIVAQLNEMSQSNQMLQLDSNLRVEILLYKNLPEQIRQRYMKQYSS